MEMSKQMHEALAKKARITAKRHARQAEKEDRLRRLDEASELLMIAEDYGTKKDRDAALKQYQDALDEVYNNGRSK